MKLARSAAAVVTAAFVVLLPTAAHADTSLRTDAWGDVQLLTYTDGSEEEPTPVPAPDRLIGDVSKTKIIHEGTTVRVEVYYRALPRAGSFNLHALRFKTSLLERDLTIYAGSDVGWAGESEFTTASGSEVACAGLVHRIEYSQKRLIVVVPRTCLKNPSFVKVGAGFVAMSGDKVWFDDGQLTAGNDEDLTLSPGVYR